MNKEPYICDSCGKESWYIIYSDNFAIKRCRECDKQDLPPAKSAGVASRLSSQRAGGDLNKENEYE